MHEHWMNIRGLPTQSNIASGQKLGDRGYSNGFNKSFYTPVERRDVLWNRPVRPSTIACERDILKTACLIDFTFWYGINTTKTSDAIDLGHSTKTKMAATAVWRLTLYPMQDIACEHDILKTACQIDFTFWYGLNTKTLDAIDLGHSTKTKMAATAVWRLTLYPMQDIACEHNILKTACQIHFTFLYGINTTKISDAIDSTKTKMAATAVYCLWTRYHENRLSDWLHILIRPYFQVVNLIPCKLHLSGV